MLQDEIREEILCRLKTVNLHKVILFGSFAWGEPHRDSDIDLIVVTDDHYLPKNYEENMSNYLKVSSVLRDMRKKMPIDLIVYTKPMYERFVDLKSMFSREVLKRGIVLYEKDSGRVAESCER